MVFGGGPGGVVGCTALNGLLYDILLYIVFLKNFSGSTLPLGADNEGQGQMLS